MKRFTMDRLFGVKKIILNNISDDDIEFSRLSNQLEITCGSVVSVIGCGGKTSLINHIAKCNKDKKVLISPTAKMFPIISADVVLCDTLDDCLRHEPHVGIQCLGQKNKETGKLEALPEQVLADMVPHYDIVLLEADGSRSLPFKGWRDDEPVVPKYSTHTVGLVTLDSLGCKATEENVHNLCEFLSLTGLNKGDIITQEAVETMVCSPHGMFKNAVGEKYLIVRS